MSLRFSDFIVKCQSASCKPKMWKFSFFYRARTYAVAQCLGLVMWNCQREYFSILEYIVINLMKEIKLFYKHKCIAIKYNLLWHNLVSMQFKTFILNLKSLITVLISEKHSSPWDYTYQSNAYTVSPKFILEFDKRFLIAGNTYGILFVKKLMRF